MKLLNDFQKKAIIDNLKKDFDIVNLCLDPTSLYDAQYNIFIRHNGIVLVSACTLGENAWIDEAKNSDSYSVENFIFKCKKNINSTLNFCDAFGRLDTKIACKEEIMMRGFLYNNISTFLGSCISLGLMNYEFGIKEYIKLAELCQITVKENKNTVECFNYIIEVLNLNTDILLERVSQHSDFLNRDID